MDGVLMTARYRITHTSRYSYDTDVSASFNEARLTPSSTRWQDTLESTLRIDQATWQHHYVDYWGTPVQVFEVTRPHRALVITARSLVEVAPRLRPRPEGGIDWPELASEQVHHEFGELLAQTPRTQPPEGLAKLAQEMAGTSTPAETARAISTAVHEEVAYLPGSTGVATKAAEAWAARSGVCQDYAHLVVGALRHIGIPARYVSGYLHPSTSPAIGRVEVGESHAWVEWWAGEWMAHDPTNDVDVADRHVMVGIGRDYADVPPIKGIVAGSVATADLEVTVEITRLV
jgi:transglutaminase-like putative cysteine protease